MRTSAVIDTEIFALADVLAFLTVPPDAGRHFLNRECFDEGF